MATHSSVHAWRIPGTGEPGGLLSMGSHSRTRLMRLSSSSKLGRKGSLIPSCVQFDLESILCGSGTSILMGSTSGNLCYLFYQQFKLLLLHFTFNSIFPHTIPLGRPSAPAPSVQYRASNLDWQLISYMIFYMFQCHSPKSSHPLPLPQSP